NSSSNSKIYKVEWESLSGSGSSICDASETFKSGFVELHVLPVPTATLTVNNSNTADVCDQGTLTLTAANTHAGGTYNISAVYTNVAIGSNIPTTVLTGQTYGTFPQTFNLIDPSLPGSVVYTLTPQRVDGQAP